MTGGLDRHKNNRIVIAGCFMLGGLAWGAMGYENIKNILLVLAAVVGGSQIVASACQSLRMKVIGMEVLVSLTVVGALFIQEYLEAAAVSLLFLLGGHLENYALRNLRAAFKDAANQFLPNGDMAAQEVFIEYLEAAHESKPAAAKRLDEFAKLYTPLVILLSCVVYILTNNFHMAIACFVGACPGALVIGAPLSSFAGIGTGVKNGVLVKGGDVMAKLATVDAVVVDKAVVASSVKGKTDPAFETMRRNGIKRIISLADDRSPTGDEAETALLEDEIAVIKRLRTAGYTVALVGKEGDNARVFASADIWATVGNTVAALDCAEVILTKSTLAQFAYAHGLAKSTLRNMKQNICLALVSAVALLLGIVSSSFHMAAGMLIHEVGIMLVILNAARLLRVNLEP